MSGGSGEGCTYEVYCTQCKKVHTQLSSMEAAEQNLTYLREREPQCVFCGATDAYAVRGIKPIPAADF